MTRIQGFLIFYRSFFLYATVILTLCGCYFYYRFSHYSHYSIINGIVMMKIATTAMMAYLAYGKKELHCYYNLGLSYSTLIVAACITDLLSFTAAIKLTQYLL